jgi:hypothetical protein
LAFISKTIDVREPVLSLRVRTGWDECLGAWSSVIE